MNNLDTVETDIPYSGKLLREKTFKILWLIAKFFFAKFGGVASFGSTSEQSVKVLSVKIFYQLLKDFFLQTRAHIYQPHSQYKHMVVQTMKS